MKRMFYSKITKFVAWTLILALTLLCVYTFYNALREYTEKGGDTVYDLGQDFESSYYVSSLLNMPVNSVGHAYMDSQNQAQQYGEIHIYHSDGNIEMVTSYPPAPTIVVPPAPTIVVPPVPTTIVSPATVSPIPYESTPAPTPTVPPVAERDDENAEKDIYTYVEEQLSHYEDAEGLEYFIKINDKVFTNCSAKSEEDLTDRRFYYLAERASDGQCQYKSSGYRGQLRDMYSFSRSDDLYGDDSIIVCAAIDDAYAQQMKTVWQEQEMIVRDAFQSMLVFLAGILILVIYLIAAAGRDKDAQIQRRAMDKLWTEVYLATMIFSGFFAIWLCIVILENSVINTMSSYYGAIPEYITEPALLATAGAGMALMLGSLLMCVRKIKQERFLKDSICYTLICFAWRISKALVIWAWRIVKRLCGWFIGGTKSFIGSVRRFMAVKTARYIIGGFFAYTSLIGLCGILILETALFFFIGLGIFAAACYALVKRARDMDEIRKGTREIRNGNLSYKIAQPQSEDLKGLANDVNEIAMGLDQSVAAKLKAEKLKTELITNVSHDLKTPLTSIISYTELLSKVEGLPEEAQDYVRIIAAKSDRLKNLTQDLFDISKVQSGSESINFEKLDVALLIEQSLGEHDSEIKASALKFMVSCDKELYILADGKKMSRVIGNLISNIFKYSMSGTRVFISAHERDSKVVMEFKNIASYLMDFDEEEIVGRFVRGDKSRSEEGNGIGLAIAKSYVEACGGIFNLTVDGDLFKVTIIFEKAP